jgi:hypothetical protein
MKYIGRIIEALIIGIIVIKVLHINRLANCDWWFILIIFCLWIPAPALFAWVTSAETAKQVSIKLYQWKRQREIRKATKKSKKVIKDAKI